ncbi:protoporphyrinogen oxidase [Brevibacterium sp. p3-SID960]|uniref:protoporphyrinogen oxidase n=1 Tax=Brevibacterium sp. p3-SID960 TaxID=2916063 RepID=UPI0021A89D5B|nr:protoporphyrinogen oxidase [Brevibacterium sp. p3-SID960]MCT1689675.1 protoporphyrinogen oxidase [Brevibacterium sp. p3-SID960]
MSTPRIVIAGAGISGLATAYRLTRALPDAEITVCEASDRLGGCLKTSTLGGQAPGGADVGAEASLFVRPETAELCAELGLDLEFPSREHSSQLFVRDVMHPMPTDTLMGVPSEPASLAGILTASEVERAGAETLTEPADGDVPVGEFIASRLGDAVADVIVDPLLGGVYAGRCRELSMAATIPALLPAAHTGTSVLEAVSKVRAQRSAASGANIPGTKAQDAPPVFMTLSGGIGTLITALADDLSARGVRIERSTPVTALQPGQPGSGEPSWTVRAGEEHLPAEAVILAVPAYAAASVLTDVDAEIAGTLGDIDYADSAVVTAVLETGAAPLSGSGFLIPPTEGRFIKASTFASNKWPWLKDALPAGTAVVRMSVGRYGDGPHAWAALDDEELAARALADWRDITGSQAECRHLEVQRWTQSLPQYRPGHLDRSTAIDTALTRHSGLGLTGAAYDGVGIPVCLKRAAAEAHRIAAGLTAAART